MGDIDWECSYERLKEQGFSEERIECIKEIIELNHGWCE